MHRRFRNIALSALSVGMVVSGLAAPHAYAEDPNMELTVSPTSQQLSVAPGETVSGTVTVLNSGKTSYEVKSYSSPYSVKDPDYTPDFANTESPRADAYRWVTIEKPDFHMSPRETVKAQYTITAPKNAAPGAHHTVLFFEVQPSDQKSGIIRKHRAGVIVYINVSGKSVTGGTAKNLAIPRFQTTAPLSTAATIENTGTTDFAVDTQMTVKSLFGQKLYHTEKTHFVMAKTSRKIAMQWDSSPWFGAYRVTTSAKVLGKVSQRSSLVFVVPIWLMIVAVVVILLLIIGGVWRAIRGRTVATASD